MKGKHPITRKSGQPASAGGAKTRRSFAESMLNSWFRRPAVWSLVALTMIATVVFVVQAAARTWNNAGTDFNTAANWTGGVPGTGDVGLFTLAPVNQPNLSASLTIAGLRFSNGSSGYILTNTGGAVLTLNAVNTTGSTGTTTASASAFRNDNTTGTTTIDAPLTLAPSTFASTIFQEAADGSTLILNGAIGQTGTVALSLKNGTIQLNNANTFSGGASVDAAGTTIVVGNDSGLGSGPFTINNASTLQAGGGARALSNAVVLGADTTISGSNAFTFNGNFTSFGSNTRALTVSNTGGATLASNVFLSESNSLARSLTLNGTSAVTISGVIANNNVGNTLASPLIYSGSNTLTLSNANTYTGATTINSGTVSLTGTGSLASTTITVASGGTFDVASHTGTVTLTNSQTLNGTNTSATPGTINGPLTLGSTSPLTLNYASGNPTLTVTNGALTLASGNQVTVSTTSALSAGDYTLISAGSGGSVAGTAPTNLTMGGSGLASGMGGVLQLVSNQLVLHVEALPSLSINDNTQAEGNGAGSTSRTFTVTRDASALTSTVNYSTISGTATQGPCSTVGNDYESTSGPLTFNSGETTKQILVPVCGDTTAEPDETYTVQLSSATNATISDADGAGTITNDDAGSVTYTWNPTSLTAVAVCGVNPLTSNAWICPENWQPTRPGAALANTTDILIFNGTVTSAPTIFKVPNQAIAAFQATNGINQAKFEADGPVTLTVNGDTGSDFSIAAGSAVRLQGTNGITISLTAAGQEGIIAGNLVFEGAAHQLTGANAGEIIFQDPSIFTTTSGFTGHPFGSGMDGSVVFAGGSEAFFGAGDDPWGGVGENIVSFSLVPLSSQEFLAASAFDSNGRTYGNLTLTGGQAYTGSGGNPLIVWGDFVLGSTSTLTLSGAAGGDMVVNGNFTDNNTSLTAFQSNGRIVKFQGGSATQTIFKAGGIGEVFSHVNILKTGGSVKLLQDIAINGNLLFDGLAGSAVDVLELNGEGVSLGGTISAVPNANSGFKGDTIGGSLFVGVNASPLGNPIHFVSGGEFLNLFFVDRASGASVDTDLTIGHPTTTPDGNLTLTDGVLDMGSKTLTLNRNATVSRNTGYVNGNVKKIFGATGTFTFPVGTGTGSAYSPVDANVQSGVGNSLTVKAVAGAQPNVPGTNKLQRYWTLSNTGAVTAHLTFHYLLGDVVGSENAYKIFKYDGTLTRFNPDVLDVTNHFATLNNVSSFSDWTLAVGSADLSISKADLPDPVIEGNALTYTLTVSNAGPDAATNVVATDTLPGSVTFVSATASQGSACTGTTTITCNLGTIANAGNATVTIVVIPNSAGTITNNASATANEADATPATDSENTLVNAAVCTTPPSGMINWWDGTGSAPTVNDIDGTNDGTQQNGATFGTGKVGQGLEFDGVDDYVSIAQSTFNGLTDLTVDGWVRFDRLDHPTSDAQAIISALQGGVHHYFTLLKEDTGQLTLIFNTTNTGSDCTVTQMPPIAFEAGRFYHIAATKSGGTIKLYIDGQEIVSQLTGCTAGIRANTGTTVIGAADAANPLDADRELDGHIDELEIFNRALTQPEIAALYDASIVGKCHTSTVTVDVAPAAVLEDGATNLVYTFTRSGDTTAPVTVNFNMFDSTTITTEYTVSGTGVTFDTGTAAGTIAIPGGVASATLTVDPTTDNAIETDETVKVNVISGANYVVGSPGFATGTIQNDDANADLSISKTDSPDPVTEGNPLTYTVTVSNAGPGNATNVVVTDTLPGSVTFFSATPSQGSPCTGSTTITCNLGTINNGGNATVQIVVIPNSAGTITNQVSATATEPDPTPATDSEDTLVNAAVCTLPPGGMINWWPADGNANNLAGTNHGTLTNGATFGPGKVGPGFELDGADDYVSIAQNTFNGLSDITVDGWVKFDRLDHPGSDGQAIISALHGGVAHYFTFMKLDTGQLYLAVTTPNSFGNCEFISAPIAFTTGHFYHLAVTKSAAGTVKFYVDGTEVFSQTQACAAGAISANTATTVIGAADAAVPTNPDRELDGNIDELEIHNTVLSGTDIANIYSASFAGKCRTCTTPPTGMVSWWDGSGSAPTANDIADGNPGTLQDGAIFAPGKVGQGFSFNGTTAYVSVGNDAVFDFTNAMTVDAWVKSDGLTMTYAPIVAKGDGAWRLQTYGNLNVASFGTTGLSDVDLVGTTNIIDGQWHHVAGVFDGSTKYLYVDGVLEASVAVSGSISVSGDEVRIGGLVGLPGFSTDRFWTGSIDEVQLFNRALSASEIAAIANAGNAGKCHTSTVTVAVSPAAVLEDGATNLVYTFTRNGDISGALPVDFSVGGSATFGGPNADYTQTGAGSFSSSSGTVTFGAGSATATVTIDPAVDQTDEPDEDVVLTITSGAGYTIGSPNTATGNITDDDPVPSITIDDVSLAEGSGGGTTAFVFTVSLSNQSSSAVDVTFTTADNTAKTTDTPTGDYTLNTGTLTIPANTSSGQITVQVGADTKLEPNETFFVNLTGATNGTITDNQGIGTIQNDDAGPTFSIGDVTLAEGDAGTTNFVFTVTKTGVTGERSRVDFSTANGTSNPAQGGGACGGSVDYVTQSGTLAFTPAETAKTITIAVCVDATYELNDTFFVNLSNPVNASITDGEGLGTITNDDAAPTITISDRPNNEGTTTIPSPTTPFAFMVTRTGSTEVASVVNWSTADGTTDPATGGGACGGSVDYLSVVSGIVTFPGTGAGSTTQTLIVSVCRDSASELNETFFVNLTGATHATIDVNDNQGLGTIQNDDSPGGALVVNTTNDVNDGVCDATHCSLREAINTANSSPSAITINFGIPASDLGHFYYADDNGGSPGTANGTVTLANVRTTTATDDSTLVGLAIDPVDPDWAHSWWSIVPASALPNITPQTVVLNGYSQCPNPTQCAQLNTASAGTNAVLRIELNGNAGAFSGLSVAGGTSSVSGLVINRFGVNAVTLTGSGKTITGNFLGTDVSGTLDLGNVGSGVFSSASNSTIGGDSPDAVNLISGNNSHGITLSNSNTNVVFGNLIGTKANGTAGLGNGGDGIRLAGGGTAFNTIGGTDTGEANTIAFNGADGVSLPDSGIGSTIQGNSIFSNGTTSLHLGIDIGADGVTGNDGLDGDSGPNNLQNFPIITLALKTSSSKTINGTLNSTAGQTFTIDFYQSPTCDDSGTHGEGKLYLGSIETAVTNGSGDVAFTFNPSDIIIGYVVTATATRVNFPSETSEFSQCLGIVGAPEINVKGNSVSIADGDNTPDPADHTNFGSASVPVGFVVRTFTIENTGTAALTISSITISGAHSGDFTPGALTPASPIPVGNSATFTVTFDPSAAGPRNAIVNIASNDADEGAYDFAILGTGGSEISANDAQAVEPTSGISQLLFVVALSSPAPGNVSVDYATANDTGGANPATGGGACGGAVDYETTNGTLNFTTGQQVKTVAVNICADGTSEPDETLLLNLTNPSNAIIVDAQAVGTITQNSSPGTLLISELRVFGPGPTNDPADEFVEIHNNTDSPITVPAGGYGLFKMGADCDAPPELVGTIPAATVIPARGHFLFTGSTYSLNDYGGTNAAQGDALLTGDIEANRNLALFSTTAVGALSTANRFDAVGFGVNNDNVCGLMREGTNQPALTTNLTLLGEHSYFRQICAFQVGCPTPGRPKDTNSNLADFIFADTSGAATSAGQRLGSPGPENLASPIKRDPAVTLVFLDATVPDASAPNRDRNSTSDSANASLFGTMTIRRRVVNQTGGTVTRLRFRVIDMTTHPSGPLADLRLRSSSDQSGIAVNDSASCSATGTPSSAPCTVTVKGLTLEQPPNVPAANGGGLNTTVTLPLPGGLPDGQSINVNFLLGVQKTGQFRFYLVIEALP